VTYSTATLPARIAGKIRARSDGCWEWTGAILKAPVHKPHIGGYGRVRTCVGGRRGHVYAHRYVYEALVGPIPADRPQLDHLCCDPAWCAGGPTCPHRRCVNPAHLEPVTLAENRRRASRHAKQCKRSHDMSGANLRIDPRTGKWICRACTAINASSRRITA
jgi:hypothetical protein